MPRWLSRSLWMIAQAAAIGGGIGPSLAASGALYHCTGEDVRRLDGLDRLETSPNFDAARKLFGDFIIDTETGTFRDITGANQWNIVQRGSDNNDFVASPGISMGRAITDFIRIRAWKMNPSITFFRVSLTTIATGRCEAIR